jgi:mercuric ion transport protein
VQKENITNFGSIVASLLAASCCIGPAIFVVFGTSIGFAGKLSFLDPLRPYLLMVAFFMLGYSFWRLYLKKADCNCKADVRTRIIARGIFWVCCIALIVSATFPAVIARIYG